MKMLFLTLVLMLSGCSIAPLKGGKATTSQSAGHIVQSVAQGENPAQSSRQDQETVRTKSYTVPAGSRLVETHVTADAGGARHGQLRGQVDAGQAAGTDGNGGAA